MNSRAFQTRILCCLVCPQEAQRPQSSRRQEMTAMKFLLGCCPHTHSHTACNYRVDFWSHRASVFTIHCSTGLSMKTRNCDNHSSVETQLLRPLLPPSLPPSPWSGPFALVQACRKMADEGFQELFDPSLEGLWGRGCHVSLFQRRLRPLEQGLFHLYFGILQCAFYVLKILSFLSKGEFRHGLKVVQSRW